MDAYMQSLPEPERETLGQALGLHKISTKEYLLHAKDFEKAAGKHGGLNDAVAMDLRAGALGVTARNSARRAGIEGLKNEKAALHSGVRQGGMKYQLPWRRRKIGKHFEKNDEGND